MRPDGGRRFHLGAAPLAGGLVSGALVSACTGARPSGPSASTRPAASTVPATGAPTTAPSAAAGDWVTFGHDARRSGVDPTSPAAGRVAPAWTSAQLDGAVYAQPLV